MSRNFAKPSDGLEPSTPSLPLHAPSFATESKGGERGRGGPRSVGRRAQPVRRKNTLDESPPCGWEKNGVNTVPAFASPA